MLSMIYNYFAEFKVLKTASKDFWLINAIQFFDGLAYFSMITIFSMYLSTNIGMSDVDAGVWVGIFSLYITAFTFAVGSICDIIGIKKSFITGMLMLVVARIVLGFAPTMPMIPKDMVNTIIKGSIIVMSMGTAFMTPVITTATRRFTTKENRSTGFNIQYLIMNIGAILSGFAVVDGFRNSFGEVSGNLYIMDFGILMYVLSLICTLLINEENYADLDEKYVAKASDRPIAIFLDVWKEPEFRRLVMFLLLTLGVRLVFTHQFLVMPKYYTRILSSDFDLGFANSVNPIIIVLGLIVFIPIIKRFNTFNMIVLGMSISAFSLVFMAIPLEWTLALPFIENTDQGYIFIIYAQIIVFALGELIFSPRFTEYTSMMAPKDKVASYMSLSALPMFIAKPINGFISGLLISQYCYDGIRAKIDTGNITYEQSPEFMWLIYLGLAILSPVAVILMRNTLDKNDPLKADIAE